MVLYLLCWGFHSIFSLGSCFEIIYIIRLCLTRGLIQDRSFSDNVFFIFTLTCDLGSPQSHEIGECGLFIKPDNSCVAVDYIYNSFNDMRFTTLKCWQKIFIIYFFKQFKGVYSATQMQRERESGEKKTVENDKIT